MLTKLETDTIRLPELRPWLGKTVEVIVRDPLETRATFLGTVERPEPTAEQWAAFRERAKLNPAYAVALAGQFLPRFVPVSARTPNWPSSSKP